MLNMKLNHPHFTREVQSYSHSPETQILAIPNPGIDSNRLLLLRTCNPGNVAHPKCRVTPTAAIFSHNSTLLNSSISAILFFQGPAKKSTIWTSIMLAVAASSRHLLVWLRRPRIIPTKATPEKVVPDYRHWMWIFDLFQLFLGLWRKIISRKLRDPSKLAEGVFFIYNHPFSFPPPAMNVQPHAKGFAYAWEV
jgi:hypothetical protein